MPVNKKSHVVIRVLMAFCFWSLPYFNHISGTFGVCAYLNRVTAQGIFSLVPEQL